MDIILNSKINNKIKTSIFTAVANNTTNVVHGIPNYDNLHDELLVYDMYSGGLLNLTENYTINVNNLSIDLVGWVINIGDKIKVVLYNGIK